MIQKIKFRFGPAIKKTIVALKARASDQLVKWLLKLDPSFLDNIQLASRTASRSDSSSPFRSAAPPTLIINEDGILTGPRSLEWAVKSMFETDRLDLLQQAVYDDLAAKQDVWASHEVVASAAKRYLQEALQKEPSNLSALTRTLQQVLNHEQSLADNRLAYSRSGKLNPDVVFWPNPVNPKIPRSLWQELPYAERPQFLNPSTKIGSAGSCFAVEMARRLQADGFNYVVTEPDPTSQNGFSPSCARWGTLFNTPSFRQLVEKAFGEIELPRLIFSEIEKGETSYYDPFREGVAFRSLAEYEENYQLHLEASRSALLQTEVFVMTLGMNEVWSMKSGGYVFSRLPVRLASGLVKRQILSVEENVFHLQRMLDLWRAHNPRLKLILSVSPVPLEATFRGNDTHVVAANCHSKSTLRIAAEEFCRRNQDIYYFPSYETVMYCTESPWDPDQRHVSKQAVSNVMRLFNEMFLGAKQAPETRLSLTEKV